MRMEMLLWGWVYPALLVLIFATSGVLLWWVCRTLLRHRLIWWRQVLCALGYFAACKGLWYSSEIWSIIPALQESLQTLSAYFLVLSLFVFPVLIFVLALRSLNTVFALLQCAPLVLLIFSLIIPIQEKNFLDFSVWIVAPPYFSSHAPNAISDFSHRPWLKSNGITIPNGAFGFRRLDNATMEFRLQAKDLQSLLAIHQPKILNAPKDILAPCTEKKTNPPSYCQRPNKPAAIITTPVVTASLEDTFNPSSGTQEIIAMYGDGSATVWVQVLRMSD